jgi:hypothetical protein
VLQINPNPNRREHIMRHLISTLVLMVIVSVSGCAGNPNQSGQSNAQADDTELRCEKRSHSGSRLGVSKCRRVSVSDSDEG